MNEQLIDYWLCMNGAGIVHLVVSRNVAIDGPLDTAIWPTKSQEAMAIRPCVWSWKVGQSNGGCLVNGPKVAKFLDR